MSWVCNESEYLYPQGQLSGQRNGSIECPEYVHVGLHVPDKHNRKRNKESDRADTSAGSTLKVSVLPEGVAISSHITVTHALDLLVIVLGEREREREREREGERERERERERDAMFHQALSYRLHIEEEPAGVLDAHLGRACMPADAVMRAPLKLHQGSIKALLRVGPADSFEIYKSSVLYYK
jgi:hypothetical protein